MSVFAETSQEPSSDEEANKEKSVFLSFARIYSGCLHKGQTVYVLQPRYDPREVDLDNPPLCVAGNPGEGKLTLVKSEGMANAIEDDDTATQDGPVLEGSVAYASKVMVSELYILMGRGVVEVESVPAGNVIGIAGLDEHILKSATVTSTLACPAFRPMGLVAAPILRVAVEPFYASGMPALAQGMKLLNQADASVEISLQATGEYILSTAGEVHLQRCLDDLQDMFSKVKLNVSAPIVPFRETIIPPPKVDTLNEAISSENVVKLPHTNPLLKEAEEETSASGLVTIPTPNKACTLLIQAKPLPQAVTALLSDNTPLLKALYLASSSGAAKAKVHLNAETLVKLRKLRHELSEAFSTTTGEWAEFPEIVDRIWAFGPNSTGSNVLLNGLPEYRRMSVWNGLELATNGGGGELRDYDNSIVYGFQLAALAGPLCEEPLRGVCFILRGWSYMGEVGRGPGEGERGSGAVSGAGSDCKRSGSSPKECIVESPVGSPISTDRHPAVQNADTYGPFSGQLISAMKEGCRRVFLTQPARLMTAMYTCDILATAEVLGRLYAVLGRRNGRVCAEEMREGSTVFSIQAVVPVAESFGFAEEVRKKTSGLASPQLVFSHWEVRKREREGEYGYSVFYTRVTCAGDS